MSGQGTNSITVTPGTTGQNGVITVTAGNTCGTSQGSTLQVAVNPLPIVNAGSDKLTQTHTNQIYNRPAFNARKKSDFSNKFQIQSIAASLDVVYMIGKFFVQPNLYLDYYIPKTTEKKLNVIFGIAVGVYL